MLFGCFFPEFLHDQRVSKLCGGAGREEVRVVEVLVHLREHGVKDRPKDQARIVELRDEVLEHGTLKTIPDLGDDLVEILRPVKHAEELLECGVGEDHFFGDLLCVGEPEHDLFLPFCVLDREGDASDLPDFRSLLVLGCWIKLRLSRLDRLVGHATLLAGGVVWVSVDWYKC